MRSAPESARSIDSSFDDGGSPNGEGGDVVQMLEGFLVQHHDDALASNLKRRASTTLQKRRATTLATARHHRHVSAEMTLGGVMTPRALADDFDPASPVDGGGVEETIRILRDELEQREEELQLAGAVGQLLLTREKKLQQQLAKSAEQLAKSKEKMQGLLLDNHQLGELVGSGRNRSASSARDRAQSDERSVRAFQARLTRAETDVVELTQENLRLSTIVAQKDRIAKEKLSEQKKKAVDSRRRRSSLTGAPSLSRSGSSNSLRLENRVKELEEELQQATLETQAERNRRAELIKRDGPSSGAPQSQLSSVENGAASDSDGSSSAAASVAARRRRRSRRHSMSAVGSAGSYRSAISSVSSSRGETAPAIRSLFAETRGQRAESDGVDSTDTELSEGMSPHPRSSAGEGMESIANQLADELAAEEAQRARLARPGAFGGRIDDETMGAAASEEMLRLRDHVAELRAQVRGGERKLGRVQDKYDGLEKEYGIVMAEADSAQRAAEHWQMQHRSLTQRCDELEEIIRSQRSTRGVSFSESESISPQRHGRGDPQQRLSTPRSRLIPSPSTTAGGSSSVSSAEKEAGASQQQHHRGSDALVDELMNGFASDDDHLQSPRPGRPSAESAGEIIPWDRRDSPAEGLAFLNGSALSGTDDQGYDGVNSSARHNRAESEGEALDLSGFGSGVGDGGEAELAVCVTTDPPLHPLEAAKNRAQSDFDLGALIDEEAEALEREQLVIEQKEEIERMQSQQEEMQITARQVADAMAAKHFRAQEQYARLSTVVSSGITQDGLRECVRSARVFAVTLSNGQKASDGSKFGIGLHALYHIKVVTGIETRSRDTSTPGVRFAGGVKEWQLERRFSDFRLLHLTLLRTCVA